MNIREYIPSERQADFDRLKEAYIRLFNDPANLKFLSYTGIPFDDEKINHFFKAHRMQGIRYYCASPGNSDITGILITKEDIVMGFEIYALVVDHHHRRKGLGKLLITCGIEAAKDLGFRSVEAAVFVDNKSMLLLLIELDFIPSRMIHHMRYDDIDLVQLKKNIA